VSAAQALRSDARVKAEAGRVRMRCGAEAGARQAEQSGPTRDGPREEGGERLARWKRRREGKFGWAGQRPGREEEKSGPGKLGRGAGREGGRESAAGPPGSRPKPGKGREKRAGPSLELG